MGFRCPADTDLVRTTMCHVLRRSGGLPCLQV